MGWSAVYDYGISSSYSFTVCYRICRSVAFHLGLHCLQKYLLGNSKLQKVNIWLALVLNVFGAEVQDIFYLVDTDLHWRSSALV